MKKVLSLILAVAMVLSLAAVAFAADNVTPWTDKETGSSAKALAVVGYNVDDMLLYTKKTHEFTTTTNKGIEFGKTIYIPLYVSETAGKIIATQDKSVNSLKLTWTPQIGGAFVESVSIVKKYGFINENAAFDYVKVDKTTVTNEDCDSATNFNGYYIAVATTGSSTSEEYVAGQIFLTGKTGDAKLKDEAVFVDFTLKWTVMNTDGTATANWKSDAFKNKTTYVLTQKTATDVTLDFLGTGKVKFDVDMVAGEKEVVKYSKTANTVIEDANEEAGIAFYNFNGATFKRSGDLFFEQDIEDEDAYLYEILADNSLKNLTSLYDEEEGGFLLKVKKLGNYCISDLPLVDAEGTVAAVAGAVNPVTGAIA